MKIWLLAPEIPPHFGGGIATYSDVPLGYGRNTVTM